MTAARLRIALDGGGTFTDSLTCDEQGKTVTVAKLPTIPEDRALGTACTRAPRRRRDADTDVAMALAVAVKFVPLLASVVIAMPVAAGIVESPECRRDLAIADQLIHAVRLRENSVQPGDFAGLCRVLRQNLRDMSRAREPMNRCMTGHEHGENVGQMDVSIGDIRTVIAKRCVGR